MISQNFTELANQKKKNNKKKTKKNLNLKVVFSEKSGKMYILPSITFCCF
jgi:hypothetical protein